MEQKQICVIKPQRMFFFNFFFILFCYYFLNKIIKLLKKKRKKCEILTYMSLSKVICPILKVFCTS